MEILSKKIKDNTFTFNCRTFETRYNWGHKVQFIVNNRIVSENKIVYYNRTWETFQYQSCINGSINLYYNKLFNNFIESYKEENNIKKLKKEKKEELKKQFNKQPFTKDLLKLKKLVNENYNYNNFKHQFINEYF